MDLVDWDQGRFEEIRSDFMTFAARLDVRDVAFIPISALHGDNVVNRSENSWWYEGVPLLSHLESVYIASDENFIDPRFPVQYVIRSQTPRTPTSAATRGRWPAGCSAPGDAVIVLPSGGHHDRHDRRPPTAPVAEAFPPMAVAIRWTTRRRPGATSSAGPNNRPS